MIFNVAGLLSGTLGDSRQHKIENEQLLVADRLLTRINGPIHLIRTDRTVILDADITAVTQAICSRCLEVATVHINVQMNEEFYPLNVDLMDQFYGDETCDDLKFVDSIRSQLEPVSLLIQISSPMDDPFELFPLPSEIIHILGSEGSVGLEKDTFNKIDSNNLEWKVEFVDEPLKLKKNGVWYIVPTKLTESIFKGCKR